MSYLGCSVHLYPQLFVGGLMSYLGCSVHLYLQLFVGGLVSYLRYLFLFTHSGVQHIMCFWFALLVFVLCLFMIAPSVCSNVYLKLIYHWVSIIHFIPRVRNLTMEYFVAIEQVLYMSSNIICEFWQMWHNPYNVAPFSLSFHQNKNTPCLI
jgi:hypothetical protein